MNLYAFLNHFTLFLTNCIVCLDMIFIPDHMTIWYPCTWFCIHFYNHKILEEPSTVSVHCRSLTEKWPSHHHDFKSGPCHSHPWPEVQKLSMGEVADSLSPSITVTLANRGYLWAHACRREWIAISSECVPPHFDEAPSPSRGGRCHVMGKAGCLERDG